MRLVPDLILAALVVGVGLGLWLDWPLASALPLLLLGLAAVGLALGLKLFGIPAGPMLLAAALLLGIWRAESAAAVPLPVIPTGSNVSAVARVADAPASSGGGYRFRAEVVEDPTGDLSALPVGTNLLVYALPPDALAAQRGRPHLRYGDTLRLSGAVAKPDPIGDFDYAAWLESEGIVGVMWARQVELAAAGSGLGPMAALHRIRTALASGIQRSIPEPAAALGPALLLGIRSELPQSVKESFRTAGMSHLLAISGLHVGVVMTLTLAAASGLLGRNHPMAIAIAALVVWGYAILSGLDPPVVRAAIMGSLFMGQGLLGRGMRGLTALLLAGAVMLAVEPHLLGSLSFQLSFTAMAGVILGLPLITALTAALSAPLSGSQSWPARWGGYGLSLLMASVVISTTTTLATVPLVAWHFGATPLMSVPATILAMPAMPAALVGGAATALAGLIAAPLGSLLGTLAWAPLAWLIWVADAMPPLLLTTEWLTAPAAAGWLAGLGLLAVAVSSRRTRRAVAGLRRGARWRPVGVAGFLAGVVPVAIIALALVASQHGAARADGLLHVYVLDIGQGDAILIVTPDGRQMLVDGGADSRRTLAAIGPLLPPGDRSLDVVAATHFDSDHAGGLLGVLDRYRTGVTLHGAGASRDAVLYPQWRAVLAHRGHRVAEIQAGHRIRLGPDVLVEALHPPPGGTGYGAGSDSNNRSMALRLEYGAVSFLFTGDIEEEAERYLLATFGPKLPADALKVAHHGSRSSTTQAFLDVVNPQTAVISAGRDNRFGHPHPEVVARLESAMGPERVFLTARDGTIEYISDGKGLWVEAHGVDGR